MELSNMKLDDFVGKPCRSKLACEFLPKHKISVDLEKAAQELTGVAAVELTSKVLIIMRVDGKTVSLFGSGKILVRGEKDEAKARLIAEKVVKSLGESIK